MPKNNSKKIRSYKLEAKVFYYLLVKTPQVEGGEKMNKKMDMENLGKQTEKKEK